MLTATCSESKTAKIKKVILLSNTLAFGDAVLSNITFLIFAVTPEEPMLHQVLGLWRRDGSMLHQLFR